MRIRIPRVRLLAQRPPDHRREPRWRDLAVFHQFVHQRQQGAAMQFEQPGGADVEAQGVRVVVAAD